MSKKLDKYVGNRYGRLVVNGYIRQLDKNGEPTVCFVCDCDCGTKNYLVDWRSMKKTKSCGCLKREMFDVSEIQVQEIVTLCEQAIPEDVIAQKVGVSVGCVRYYANIHRSDKQKKGL